MNPDADTPERLTNVQVRDQLRALGYQCSLAWPGMMDIGGRLHLLSNDEFRAFALSPGPHPLDLTAHSEAMSSLNRRYSFPAPEPTGSPAKP